MSSAALIPELRAHLKGSLRRTLVGGVSTCAALQAFMAITGVAGAVAGVRLPTWLWALLMLQFAIPMFVLWRRTRVHIPALRKIDEEIVLAEFMVAAGLLVREGVLLSEVRETLFSYLPESRRMRTSVDQALEKSSRGSADEESLGLRLMLLGFAYGALAEHRMRQTATFALPILGTAALATLVAWSFYFAFPFMAALGRT